MWSMIISISTYKILNRMLGTYTYNHVPTNYIRCYLSHLYYSEGFCRKSDKLQDIVVMRMLHLAIYVLNIYHMTVT